MTIIADAGRRTLLTKNPFKQAKLEPIVAKA